MPKVKTNKAFKKRFKVTKNGKVLACKSSRRHLMGDKPAKQRRQSRGWKKMNDCFAGKIKRLLPYS